MVDKDQSTMTELNYAIQPLLLRINSCEMLQKFNVLLDTGSALSLISANHPILNNAPIFKSEKFEKLKGAFSAKFVCVRTHTFITIAIEINKRQIILGEIRFNIVDTDANFGIILGYKDIKKLNISIGRTNKIQIQNENFELPMESYQKLHTMGMDPQRLVLRIFCDYGFDKDKLYTCVINDDEFTVQSSILSIPKEVKIKQPVKFEPCTIANMDTKVCFEIQACSDQQPKLPELDLNACVIGSDLTDDQKEKVRLIIGRYKDVFSNSQYDLGKVKSVEYEVKLSTDTPQKCRTLNLSEKNKQVIHEELISLEKSGVIERDDSIQVITSTFIPIQKQDGSVRLVSDFRSTNNIIRASNLDLPTIQEILTKVANYRYYTAMDLRKAYWSVKLRKDQRIHFTVTDPVTFATFKYKRLPMGVKTASSHFQRIAANAIFKNIDPKYWSLYIDDNLIVDDDFNNALKNLETALSNMRESGFKLNFKKCSFLMSSVQVFGFIVSQYGVKADPSKMSALEQIEIPKTRKQLQKTLGALGYYRTVIKNYSHYSSDLYELLKGKGDIEINANYEKAWRNLIDQFKKRLELHRPDFTKRFILETDASGKAIGAVLKQEINGMTKVIGLYSYKLKVTERSWECSARELYAIYRAVSNFKDYLYGREFDLRTDSRVNVILLTAKMNQVRVDGSVSSPAYRFLLYLSRFSFKVHHTSGEKKSFLLTDLLSRLNLDTDNKVLEMGKNMRSELLFLRDLKNGKLDALTDTDNPAKVSYSIQLEPKLRDAEVIEGIKLAQQNSKFCESLKKNPKTGITIVDNNVYKFGKLIVPKFYIREFLEIIHEHGQGAIQLVRRINELNVTMERKYPVVKRFVKSCEVCNQVKPFSQKKFIDKTVNMVSEPNEALSLDIMKFGSIAVLICVCDYSGFIRYRILKNEKAVSVRSAMLSLFLEWSPPQRVKTDNGTNFVAKEIREFMELFGILHTTIIPTNSRGNAIAENSIMRIQTELRVVQPSPDGSDLEDAMALACFTINSRCKQKSKYTPFELVFHRTPEWVKQCPKISNSKKSSYDEYLKSVVKVAETMRSEVMRNKFNELKALESEIDEPNRIFKKGGIVKVRQVQRPGTLKKLFRPFSAKNYRIIRVLPFANSLLLEEINDLTSMRPIRIRQHMRFCKPVHLRNPEEESFKEDEKANEPVEINNEGTEAINVEQEVEAVVKNHERSHKYNLRSRK